MKWAVVLCIGGVVGLFLGVLLSKGIGGRSRSEPDWRETALANTLANRRAYTLPLNNPDMIPADRAAHMKDEDVVLGVLFRGTARAYPWWLISNYHVVNDTVDEVPLLITLCEVCGGAAAFQPVVPDLPGITLTFQITGVRHGTIELGDHQSWSKWHPFLGTASSGPLKGRALERHPLLLLKWREWLELYPDSLVVNGSPELRERFHGSESGHIGEDVIPDLFLRSANLTDNRLERHEIILGIAFPDTGKAYAVPTDKLVPYPNLFMTELDGKRVLIARQAELAMTAFDISQADYRTDFTLVSKVPLLFRSADGLIWDAFGWSTDWEDDANRLTPTRGYLTEWYEWVTHSPQTEIVDSVQGVSNE